MPDGLAGLALYAALFVGSHFLMSYRPVRSFLIRYLTLWPFRIVYSAISVFLFLRLMAAYRTAPASELFQPGLAIAPLLLMPLAAILVFCGYTIINPSAVGMDVMARGGGEGGGEGRPIPGILKITRQPTMWGVALFALSHMAAKPDAAAWIFFGSLAVLALAGSYFLDRRKQAAGDANWQALMAQSSFVPFAAVISGRTRVTLGEIGWWRIFGGLALFGGLLAAHAALFGVSPLATAF